MKRCTKCILPETFPKIVYDENGVCNYCLSYKSIKVYGEKSLLDIMNKFRNQGDKYDCIVPISGGRDSSFVLYNIVKKYKMRTLAVTIDFGFSTDEAINNMQSITKTLNIDHIILKDEKAINLAKQNFKNRFHAWLKKPSINLIIPMITSADKTQNLRLYKYAKDNDIHLLFFGSGTFEQEHFKTGYLGVFPDEKGVYRFTDKIKLAFLFGFEFIKNYHYFQWSIFRELIYLFYQYYFGPSDINKPQDVSMIGFYDYVSWNEKEILSTITTELGWKGASDTTTTWRIDDRYSTLYNYIYYKLVGFTEHDELYSKMIREGQISRKDALKRCKADHIPRIPSLMDIFKELEVTKEEVDEALERYRTKLLKKITTQSI